MTDHTTEHELAVGGPVDLYVEAGKGRVHVTARETDTVRVRLEGRDAEGVEVARDGDRITVVAPRLRGGFLAGEPHLRVDVIVPVGSDVAVRTTSADVVLEGALGGGQVRSGSGDVEVDTFGADASVQTGSGGVRVVEAGGELRVKSGSGQVSVGRAAAGLVVATGSGDVELGTVTGPTLVKTGSGDLTVHDAHTDVSLSTSSGDLSIHHVRRGKVAAKGASGDVRVGIPAGVPVWTDITTVSGVIRSDLPAAGEPGEGQDHVELRAKTVSGDVVLVQA